jgi:hypothetical protein
MNKAGLKNEGKEAPESIRSEEEYGNSPGEKNDGA